MSKKFCELVLPAASFNFPRLQTVSPSRSYAVGFRRSINSSEDLIKGSVSSGVHEERKNEAEAGPESFSYILEVLEEL